MIARTQPGIAGHPRYLPYALLALTLTTGLVDAVSYLGLGHVFAANMTGNIVLLGFGLARAGGLPVVAPLVSLAAFVLGALVAGRAMTAGFGERRRVLFTAALAVEAVLLVAGAIVAAAGTVRVGSAGAYAVIAVLAVAMGVRNAVVRRLAVPDLTTTVLTLTITGIAADSRAAGGSGRASPRRIAAVVAMLAGAFIGGLLQKQGLAWPLWLAAAVAVAVAVVSVLARD